MPRIPNQYRAERLSLIKTMKRLIKSYQPQLLPASQASKKVIIFDLDGVLCTTNTWQACNIIGWKTIFHYIVDQWKFPSQLFLYKALADTPAKSKIRSFAADRIVMPAIMVDWQCNLQSPETIKAVMIKHINSSRYSAAQKDFLLKVIELKMNPERLIASRRAIKTGVKLIHELKDLGYKLYVISNWDFQSFPLLKKQFPKIFIHDGKKMFDGIMTSGQAKIAKPYHTIYEQTLSEFNINPQEAIFIDDVIENIHAAEKLGIQSIHCVKKNMYSVATTLAKILKQV
ncbi:HAD-IA family hydrolase [Candidatus Babeliales bacterium]|nr:HAD-IA family hydrolase [Candidatus Babeliales bacterium]MBP9843756.1 HAD-IA family hydrolase [Candidatus Babeliales bacterium]